MGDTLRPVRDNGDLDKDNCSRVSSLVPRRPLPPLAAGVPPSRWLVPLMLTDLSSPTRSTGAAGSWRGRGGMLIAEAWLLGDTIFAVGFPLGRGGGGL